MSHALAMSHAITKSHGGIYDNVTQDGTGFDTWALTANAECPSLNQCQIATD